MRPITGTDIIDFYNSRHDLLALTASGEYTRIDKDAITRSSYEDGRAASYDFVTTNDGDEVQILLDRSAIADGDWYPDALDDGGKLIPAVADEMADTINADGILPSRVMKARAASEAWEEAQQTTDRRAMERAVTVAEVVDYCRGNQSAAGRLLGLDQSTVNKLVRKAKAAASLEARLS